MNDDPASLSNLHDIVVPGAVPWWPPAPGWYVAMGIAVLGVLILAVQWIRRYRHNAYRRSALGELASLPNDPAGLPPIATLLKRTALAVYPRERVAQLSGAAWIDWLADTGGLTVPESVASALMRDVYVDRESANVAAVSEFASQWIRCHKGPEPC